MKYTLFGKIMSWSCFYGYVDSVQRESMQILLVFDKILITHPLQVYEEHFGYRHCLKSISISFQAIQARGGVYLEAPVVGSRVPALEGQLTILASGDRKLFDDCFSCFEAIGKKSLYLGRSIQSYPMDKAFSYFKHSTLF